MVEISQNVNIEMLEKLPDGTYKRKYPKTRADDGTTFDEHLAESTQQAHLAKNIGLEDTSGNFVATEVEGAMNELFTNVSNGKSLVGGAITDVDDSVVIPTDPTFNDLALAIGGISTGKKWASGTAPYRSVSVSGLSFTPSIIIVFNDQRNTYNDKYRMLATYWKGTQVNMNRALVSGRIEDISNLESPWVVTSDGFSLTFERQGLGGQGPSTWIAFE